MKKWQKIFFVTAATAMLTILAVTTANAAFVDNALNSVIEWISDKIWAIYELVTPAASVTSSDFMSAFAGAFPTLYFASDRIGLVGLFFALGICLCGLLRQFLEPLGFKSESPVLLVLNTLIFSPVIYWARNIGEILVSFIEKAAARLTFTGVVATDRTFQLTDLLKGGKFTVALLLLVLFSIMLLKNYIAFLGEYYEVYLTLCALVVFAPLAVATIVSQSTRGVASKWLQMVVGQCFMLTLYKVISNAYSWSIRHVPIDLTSLDIEIPD